MGMRSLFWAGAAWYPSPPHPLTHINGDGACLSGAGADGGVEKELPPVVGREGHGRCTGMLTSRYVASGIRRHKLCVTKRETSHHSHSRFNVRLAHKHRGD